MFIALFSATINNNNNNNTSVDDCQVLAVINKKR